MYRKEIYIKELAHMIIFEAGGPKSARWTSRLETQSRADAAGQVRTPLLHNCLLLGGG